MKARRVKRLDPRGTLADNAERIVRVRLDELCGFVPAVLDPAAVRELHDMRIAAKRVRYVLEVTADACFGPYARVAAKRAKELQDLLGEIHDCDVQLPRVEALLLELREADAAELRRRAGDAPDLDPALAARLPHGEAWSGLVALETYLRARRDLLYERFTAFWRELEREAFRARLEYAIGERPAPAPEAAEPAFAAPPPPSPPAPAPVPPLPPTMPAGGPEAPVGPVVPAPDPAPAGGHAPAAAPHPLHHARGGIHPTVPAGAPEAPAGPPAADPDEAPEDRA